MFAPAIGLPLSSFTTPVSLPVVPARTAGVNRVVVARTSSAAMSAQGALRDMGESPFRSDGIRLCGTAEACVRMIRGESREKGGWVTSFIRLLPGRRAAVAQVLGAPGCSDGRTVG